MKNIQIITTGGTIGMSIDPKSNGAKPDNFSFITENAPLFASYAEIHLDTYLNIPSPHMTLKEMYLLAKRIQKYLDDPKIDGVVITHGTDTMEETAFYLHHVLTLEKPVVITGAMQNQSEKNFDGLQNLLQAVHVATLEESKNRGVLLAFQDEVHSPITVTKTHPDRLPFFESLVVGPVAKRLLDNQYEWLRTETKPQRLPLKPLTKNVALFTAYAGMDNSYIDWAIQHGFDGIVVEALGLGHLPPASLPSVSRALEKGIPIIITSRCAYSITGVTYAYEGGGKYLKELGCILSNVNGPKARILLNLVLEHTNNLKEIETYFG